MTGSGPRRTAAPKLFLRLPRYLGWAAVVCAHYDWLDGVGGPPTLSELQARSRLSPRQVSELVAGLAAGRWASVAADPADLRRRLVAPGHAMVLAFAEHLRRYLDLYDAVCPADPTGHDSGDADLFGRMVARAFRGAPELGVIAARYPRVYRFAARDGGYATLCAVALRALCSEPEEGDAPLSLSGLAAQLQVSKAHVGALLAEARGAGLFRVERGRLVEGPSPPLAEEFAGHVARNALYYAGTLRELRG